MKSHSFRFLALVIVLTLATLSCKLLSPNVSETVSAPEVATEVPQEIITESPLEIQTEVASDTSFITDVVMAKDVNSDTYEPIDVTDTFDTTQSIFHCVVAIKNAPENTNIKSIWSVVSVEGVENGYVMAETELAASGSGFVNFSLEPSNGNLPPGDYQVQILVNGNPHTVVTFSVR
ncbi:MAG: hypothetical protein ACPL4H_03150 [Anaerolineales bacterium]